MTAEIAILNRGAVALAADSAVTITTPTGPKIYESVNKLFALIKNRPVGSMIFDSADLIGVPWETIIKAYRMDRERYEAPSLAEYAADLLNFLVQKPALLGPELQHRFLISSVTLRVRQIRQDIDDAVRATLEAGSRRSMGKDRLRQIIELVISSWDSRVTSLEQPAWATEFPTHHVKARHSGVVDEVILDVFQQLPIGVRQRARLGEIVCEWLTKDAGFEAKSGLVIAGFGADEYFPGLIHYEVSGLFDDHLRVRTVESFQITPQRYAVIAPFAQRDVVDAFITGLSSRFDNMIMGYLGEVLLRGFPDIAEQIAQAMLSGSLPSEFRQQLDSAGGRLMDRLKDLFLDMQDEAAQPIVESVGFLPKDELAAMAESLVNLTSLRRRVSISEAQTVGGPVDVAVISRGDGFVWIKRKHYFNSDLNPAWSLTHAGTRRDRGAEDAQ